MHFIYYYLLYNAKAVHMDESLPKLADVILKVKQLQNLTPAEEFVYLIFIEEVPEDIAKQMIAEKIKTQPKSFPKP
jgi:hypothetical protein